MRQDKWIRILALIGLCALVYYFSFDQGRQAQNGRVVSLETALAAKEKSAEGMAVEIRSLKTALENCRRSANQAAGEGVQAAGGDNADGQADEGRLSLRLGAARTLFENQVTASCLEIDRSGNRAMVQINNLDNQAVVSKWVGLGQALPFNLSGRPMILILEELHPSMITARVIPKPGSGG